MERDLVKIILLQKKFVRVEIIWASVLVHNIKINGIQRSSITDSDAFVRFWLKSQHTL